MQYIKDYTSVTQRFNMSDKPKGVFDPQSEEFKELVVYALRKAFNDFNFRTLKKHTKFDEDYKTWEKTVPKKDASVVNYLIKRLGKPFLERFVTYFKEDAPADVHAFDKWHNQTCQLFMDALNGEGQYKTCTKAYEELRYGKAQKIVNMMFKHLYCLVKSNCFDAHFIHCHMVLDNFTLEWFKRTLGKKRIDSWSNLVYEAASSEEERGYCFYQEAIRTFFKEQTQERNSIYQEVTPFQAEFYIWPEIQLRLAAEGFIYELAPDDYKGNGNTAKENKAKVKGLALADLIVKVESTIQNYKATQ